VADDQRWYRYALGLSIFTVVANLVEGVASTLLGFQDETLALFGFGIDSFIEVISALGIVWMVWRITRQPESSRSQFEVIALRITGISFYLLTAGLVLTTVLNFIQGARPESTRWGIVISLISISVMGFLVWAKRKVGHRLHSDAIIADANCTRACIYMSVVLLASSLIYSFTGFAFLDSLGALGIAWFAFSEGREAFEKASGKEECSCHCAE
jgi:divalent metal cation (Fe/Co/Zn/Cd) transporter